MTRRADAQAAYGSGWTGSGGREVDDRRMWILKVVTNSAPCMPTALRFEARWFMQRVNVVDMAGEGGATWEMI